MTSAANAAGSVRPRSTAAICCVRICSKSDSGNIGSRKTLDRKPNGRNQVFRRRSMEALALLSPPLMPIRALIFCIAS